jgi:hypothetical protein
MPKGSEDDPPSTTGETAQFTSEGDESENEDESEDMPFAPPEWRTPGSSCKCPDFDKELLDPYDSYWNDPYPYCYICGAEYRDEWSAVITFQAGLHLQPRLDFLHCDKCSHKLEIQSGAAYRFCPFCREELCAGAKNLSLAASEALKYNPFVRDSQRSSAHCRKCNKALEIKGPCNIQGCYYCGSAALRDVVLSELNA